MQSLAPFAQRGSSDFVVSAQTSASLRAEPTRLSSSQAQAEGSVEPSNDPRSKRMFCCTRMGSGDPLLHAIPISLFILSLFYYWFAIADRYAIFLYEHLGATPFDQVTSSRYWMAGLVACGAVMIVYTLANWLLGWVVASHHPPAWWRVWALCALPLVIGIPAITMTVNWPTLPLPNAITCTVIALIGLALALMPGSLAARQPSELAWLISDGAGLVPSLLLLRAVELPGRGLAGVTTTMAYLVALGGTLAGMAWLGIMTGLRAGRRKPVPGASAVFLAGICLSYLLMPLVHHLLATPTAYRYISTASNFFAFNPWVQLMAFFMAATLAVGTTRLRQKLLP